MASAHDPAWDAVFADESMVDATAVLDVLTDNFFWHPSKLNGFPATEVQNLKKYGTLNPPQKALLARVVQRCSQQMAPCASWLPDLGIRDAFSRMVGKVMDAGDPVEDAFEKKVDAGNFDKDRDCCVCWLQTAPSTTYRIPCGHLICTTCLPKFQGSTCPLKCKHGVFKRADVMARYNLLELPQVKAKAPRKRRFGRAWVDEDDFEPVISPLVNQNAHAVVITRCNKEDCPNKGLEIDTLQLGLGCHDFDVLDLMCGPCGEDMEILRFSVAQCFMKVDVIELFNNHGTKPYKKVCSAIGRTLTFSTNGFYRKLELHLAHQEFAQPTPLPSLQCLPVGQQKDLAWKGYASDKQYMHKMMAIQSTQPCSLSQDHAEMPLDTQCPKNTAARQSAVVRRVQTMPVQSAVGPFQPPVGPALHKQKSAGRCTQSI